MKLGIFFNQKYVLYYLNKEHILYTRSFVGLADSFKYLSDFFRPGFSFNTTDFKRENTWLQNISKHFLNQDFHYQVTIKSAWKFLFSTSGLSFAGSLLMILLFSINGYGHISKGGGTILFIFLFIFGGGINLILFFSFYFHSRDMLLVIFRGNDIFNFGQRTHL